jgi:hypothetical protein
MTLDQKYFFWGCGRPIQYGLYSPVVDRFVCVGDNSDVVYNSDHSCSIFENILFLMSGKIRLLIVPLHRSTNFKIDLIDNYCCTQWGVTNWPANSLDEKLNLANNKRYFMKNDFVFDTCGDLIEKSNKNLIEIQNFIFLAHDVIRVFKFSNNYQYRIYSDLIKLPFDEFNYLKNIENQCYQTLYLESDYNKAKEKIEKLCTEARSLLCHQ